MTNQEIDYTLALAIGYTPDRVWISLILETVYVLNNRARCDGPMDYEGWQLFNHADPEVIWPIAKKFDCFPRRASDSICNWWTLKVADRYFDSDTPERAAARAVIEHCNKGQP